MSTARIEKHRAARNAARAALDKWIEGNKRTRALRTDIMTRLRDSTELDRTWFAFSQFELLPIALASYAIDSVRQAEIEMARDDVKSERRQIERVAKAARKLKAAIEDSPLPENTLSWLAFEYPPNKPVELEVGWRKVTIEGVFAPVLVFSDLAGDIASLAEEHLKKLTPRAVARRRRAFEHHKLAPAFVRWLNFSLNQRYCGKHTATLIADVANAVLPGCTPLDSREVQGILKDAPAEFLVLPKRAPLAR